jgi:hypothetical protein
MLDVLQFKIVVDAVMPAVGTEPSFVIMMFVVAVQPLLAVTTTV